MKFLSNLKDMLDQPFTWGGYLKLCLVAVLMGMISAAITFAYYMGVLDKWIGKVKEFFKPKSDFEIDYDLDEED